MSRERVTMIGGLASGTVYDMETLRSRVSFPCGGYPVAEDTYRIERVEGTGVLVGLCEREGLSMELALRRVLQEWADSKAPGAGA